jgi:beta-lactamase regulating signal transducer with metallopeptidase domain
MIALLSLPFAKVAFDAAKGIPESSFLWLRAHNVPQDLGSFHIGLGVTHRVVPIVKMCLGALSDGKQYTQSAADLLAAILVKRVSSWAPAVIAAALLAVGVARLGARLASWARARADERAMRRDAPHDVQRVGWRSVAIYLRDVSDVSPFTGGVLSPFVCFPRAMWEALTPTERSAAVAHELGHAAHHHLLVVTLAGIIADVFWFVPWIGAAERRLKAACELDADTWAVARGASPLDLASALVRVREGTRGDPRLSRALLFAVDASLPARVERLMSSTSPEPRWIFRHPIGRLAAIAWVAAALVFAVAFGNH